MLMDYMHLIVYLSLLQNKVNINILINCKTIFKITMVQQGFAPARKKYDPSAYN